MIFNSTLIYSLAISSFYDHSPLLALNPFAKDCYFQMKGLKLSNFFNNALKINYLPRNCQIDNSKFNNFLDTVIMIRSEPECEIITSQPFVNIQIVPIRCLKVMNSTFRNIKVAYQCGGSINCFLSEPADSFYVDRCNFTNCKAKEKGGAIFFKGQMNSFSYNAISYCNFIECYVNDDEIVKDTSQKIDDLLKGGSVFCEANYVNFRNSVFNSSYIAGDGYGGAIYAKVNSIENYTYFTSFYNCSISGDSQYGGALYIELVDKSSYNMSYMTFDSCKAKNGSCVYAKNISHLNINYTKIKNIESDVLKVDNLNFTFKVGALILDSDKEVQLISADNTSNYFAARKIIMDLYTQLSFNPTENNHFFDQEVITYCFAIIHDINKLSVLPVDPPDDASIPIDESGNSSPGVPPTKEVSTLPTTNPDPLSSDPNIPPIPSTNYFSQSYSFTISNTFIGVGAAAAAGSKSGLSTVAIIFIVIACLIVVIAIIIFVIFYLRSHGRCQCGGDSLAGKSSTYF